MPWSKLNQIALASIAKINQITVDATPASGEVKGMNSINVAADPVPTGIIIPYTAGAGGAPANWTMYTDADNFFIVGAGSTYAVDATAAASAA